MTECDSRTPRKSTPRRSRHAVRPPAEVAISLDDSRSTNPLIHLEVR